MTQNNSRLIRRLTLKDAVVLGLGSMIGAGIFAAAGPAAQAAGTGLLIGLILAAGVAFLNATTMAQLAAIYPESGGTYVYGRKRLGNFWGFIAGWGFVIGKLASCTAMALTFAYYANPQYAKPLAITAVLILTFINYLGIKKTAMVTRILVAVVLAVLVVVVFSSLGGGAVDYTRVSGFFERGGISGILQAAGMLFFAFAGYARIATLGEEVVEPQKTIPKAVVLALSITVMLYILVFGSVVLTVDIEQLAYAKAPVVMAVQSGSYSYLSPLVRMGACFAALGVLLSLMAGISRTIFSMAANKDLPVFFSHVHPKHKVPDRAELAVGLIVACLVWFADLRGAIGFSSFAILTYYAIANLAGMTLSSEERLWPKWMSVLGFATCILIALSLPASSIMGGVILFILGAVIYFSLRLRPI